MGIGKRNTRRSGPGGDHRHIAASRLPFDRPPIASLLPARWIRSARFRIRERGIGRDSASVRAASVASFNWRPATTAVIVSPYAVAGGGGAHCPPTILPVMSPSPRPCISPASHSHSLDGLRAVAQVLHALGPGHPSPLISSVPSRPAPQRTVEGSRHTVSSFEAEAGIEQFRSGPSAVHLLHFR